MASTIKADFNLAIPFDNPLYVDPKLINFKKQVNYKDVNFRFEFPGEKEKDSLELMPPKSCSKKITKYLPEEHWGIFDESQNYASINACFVAIPTEGKIHFELTKGQVGGDTVKKLFDIISEWFNSFVNWVWVLTAQSLNPIYPDPKVINRKSRNIIITLTSEGKSSIPKIQSPAFEINVIKDDQLSEQIVNEKVLNLAVTSASAGSIPPLSLELLTSARMAARRRDRRRALSDAGTAAELALSKILDLNEGHKLTLGRIVKKAFKKGIKIPADTENSLVFPRNDATHRGIISKSDSIGRALEITEEIVSLSVPELIPFSKLNPVFRPYRQNMSIIIPKQSR